MSYNGKIDAPILDKDEADDEVEEEGDYRHKKVSRKHERAVENTDEEEGVHALVLREEDASKVYFFCNGCKHHTNKKQVWKIDRKCFDGADEEGKEDAEDEGWPEEVVDERFFIYNSFNSANSKSQHAEVIMVVEE